MGGKVTLAFSSTLGHQKPTLITPPAMSPEVLDQRRESVEHPFGSIKQWMGQRNFLTRRIENVRGEFSLTALAYNIRRALTLVGVVGLMRAISA